MKPTKVVIGVDGRAGDEKVTRLTRRLRFGGEASCDVEAVNVIESLPMPWYGAGEMSTPEMIQQFEEIAEENGARVTGRVAEAFAGQAHRIRTAVRHGAGADQLIAHAEDIQADLIAVAGSTHGPLGAFLTGSVGRSLVIGAKQSVLFAKGDVAADGPVRAVLATDHSRYADHCLGTLLDLAPRGISHLTVMTAYPRELIEAIRPLLPDFTLDPADWVADNLCDRNRRVIEVLEPLGCAFDSRVVNEHADEAIRKVMEDTNADLLIMGAQGHNWVERLTLGSVSFRQVVSEPYATLVLRAPREATKESAA